jgi:alkylation response protein AidB-like acyl-CoA dehydrogenase
MAHEFADFHDELRSVAADLLGKGSGAPVDWPLLAQAGWIGLETPDEFGGAGATFAEVAIILEQMGRAATSSAYIGAAVLGIGALNTLQPNVLRDALLGDVSSGSVRIAVALAVGDDDSAALAVPFAVTATADGLRVDGRSAFVPDAADAERLLLLARDETGTPVIVDVASPADGLDVTAQPVLDGTRSFAAVTADSVAVTESSVWAFGGDADALARALLDRAVVSVACDSLGLSEAMLAATVSYSGVRQQFGRPIGSFQAVKHACADMLVKIAVTRQLVSAAVDAVAEGDPDSSTAASMAKSYACGVAVDVVGKAMQLHGGIGYTWESGVHVYLKRAALNRSLFGSPAAHRRQLAQRYRSR